MLAQLPPLGFPGSLTIFLLSPISSLRNCSNRGERERWGDRGEGWGRRGEREHMQRVLAWVWKVK